MPDASRAVGVASALLERRAAPALLVAEVAGGVPRDRRAPRARSARRRAASTLEQARANRLPHRLGRRTRRRAAAARRHARSPTTTSASSSRYIDWTPFFRTWELAGHLPRDPRRPDRRARSRAACTATRRRCSSGSSPSAGSSAAAVVGLWPANARRRRHRRLRGRAARARRSRRCTRCASSSTRDAEHPNHALADFVAPAGRRRRPRRRLRGHRPAIASASAPSASSATTTTTARSSSRRSATGSPRPSPSACTSGSAASCGATRRDESLDTRRADRRALPRHPPGARLRLPARPHREADDLRRCSTPRRTPASSSPRAARCTPARRSAGSTSRTRPRATSASGGSAPTSSRTTRARKGWTLDGGAALAGADPRRRPSVSPPRAVCPLQLLDQRGDDEHARVRGVGLDPPRAQRRGDVEAAGEEVVGGLGGGVERDRRRRGRASPARSTSRSASGPCSRSASRTPARQRAAAHAGVGERARRSARPMRLLGLASRRRSAAGERSARRIASASAALRAGGWRSIKRRLAPAERILVASGVRDAGAVDRLAAATPEHVAGLLLPGRRRGVQEPAVAARGRCGRGRGRRRGAGSASVPARSTGARTSRASVPSPITSSVSPLRRRRPRSAAGRIGEPIAISPANAPVTPSVSVSPGAISTQTWSSTAIPRRPCSSRPGPRGGAVHDGVGGIASNSTVRPKASAWRSRSARRDERDVVVARRGGEPRAMGGARARVDREPGDRRVAGAKAGRVDLDLAPGGDRADDGAERVQARVVRARERVEAAGAVAAGHGMAAAARDRRRGSGSAPR